MTEQEKELALLLNSFRPKHREKWLDKELLSAARALIQTYPQILAEKVLDDIPNNETIKDFSSHFFSCALKSKHIQVFIREVVS